MQLQTIVISPPHELEAFEWKISTPLTHVGLFVFAFYCEDCMHCNGRMRSGVQCWPHSSVQMTQSTSCRSCRSRAKHDPSDSSLVSRNCPRRSAMLNDSASRTSRSYRNSENELCRFVEGWVNNCCGDMVLQANCHFLQSSGQQWSDVTNKISSLQMCSSIYDSKYFMQSPVWVPGL